MEELFQKPLQKYSSFSELGQLIFSSELLLSVIENVGQAGCSDSPAVNLIDRYTSLYKTDLIRVEGDIEINGCMVNFVYFGSQVDEPTILALLNQQLEDNFSTFLILNDFSIDRY